MTYRIILTLCILPLLPSSMQANWISSDLSSGLFSLGTRNTFSVFSEDKAPGIGIGGQFRLQFSDRINTEWYFDYITARPGADVFRNDYHIGWSVMYYLQDNKNYNKLLTPYLVAGHCFDYVLMAGRDDRANFADRYSMATQAGAGLHLNITPRFDATLTGQYMIHFGKEIEVNSTPERVSFKKKDYSAPDGHWLVTLSFNYKFADLW